MWTERGSARALGGSLLVLSCSLFSPVSRADPPGKADCAAAYERSQELRNAGKMRESEGTLVRCADSVCPGFIQADCTQWLVEVQRDMPTVVVTAKDERGAETVHVQVKVDGEVMLPELDGRARSVDPGLHTFRFELEGAKALEQKVLIRQGQKSRVLEVSFAPGGGDLPAESPYADFPRAKELPNVPPEPEPSREFLRPYAYVAGGVGLAGVLTFAVLGATGKSRENELRRTCVDRCNPDEVDSVRTKYVVADVALGVGIVGIGSAVALFLLSQPNHHDAGKSSTSHDLARSPKFDVRTAPGSAVMTFSGAF